MLYWFCCVFNFVFFFGFGLMCECWRCLYGSRTAYTDQRFGQHLIFCSFFLHLLSCVTFMTPFNVTSYFRRLLFEFHRLVSFVPCLSMFVYCYCCCLYSVCFCIVWIIDCLFSADYVRGFREKVRKKETNQILCSHSLFQKDCYFSSIL